MKKHEICAVVISYNPEQSILFNMECLLPQVQRVVIVDNGSQGLSQRWLEQLEKKDKISILRNAQNLGIASALNQGVAQAIAEHYGWIATFDQDSRVPEHFFQTMSDAYEMCEYKEKVGMITPVYYDPSIEVTLKSRKCNGKKYVEITGNMTSGNLLPSKVFQDVGTYQSDFFIDYVDYEFCLRLRAHHYRVIQSCQSVLYHHLGAPSVHVVLGKKIKTLNQPPVRCYYRARNRILVYRRYWASEPVFCLRDAIDAIADIFKIIFLETNSFQKLLHILKGIAHGVSGKAGPIHP